MPKLIITVDFTDDGDLEFFKHRLVGVVEDEVETAVEPEDGSSSRVDGKIEVEWETDL